MAKLQQCLRCGHNMRDPRVHERQGGQCDANLTHQRVREKRQALVQLGWQPVGAFWSVIRSCPWIPSEKAHTESDYTGNTYAKLWAPQWAVEIASATNILKPAQRRALLWEAKTLSEERRAEVIASLRAAGHLANNQTT